MRRRTFLTLGNEGIKASEAMACDICLYNKTTQKLLIVKSADFSVESYPSENYSPVGVVVIPGSHNVYGDGSCAVMSSKSINGGTGEYGCSWGPNNPDISTLNNFVYLPNVFVNNTAGDETSTITKQMSEGYFPSDNITSSFSSSRLKCPHDTDAYYYSSYAYYCPSPYLTDESRNHSYYQTSSPSSTSNALSDFDGKGNTSKILTVRGEKDYSSWTPSKDYLSDYEAISLCDMHYTDGTEQGDWYMPSCGELGYMAVKWRSLNTSLTKLSNAYGSKTSVKLSTSYYYWTSTEYNTQSVRLLDTDKFNLSYAIKNVITGDTTTRPFLKLK